MLFIFEDYQLLNALIKISIYQQDYMKQLGWSKNCPDSPILQVPLQFNFEPVQVLSKELTKLNSTSPYRIVYLGPRWGNSSLFHKMYSQKHGYSYDLGKVNRNNNFFSESMHNNQFYRNEIYYRAFEGNNPTLKETELVFDSRFESGNLDCAVKVSDFQYDLFLRIDSNTRGHIFWYNFTVSNGQTGQKIKLNICNLTKKSVSIIDQKLKPYVYRDTPQNSNPNQRWTQDKVSDVTYRLNRLRYEFLYQKIKMKPYYELSFQYTFKSNQQVTRFAYCIPYTYTDLTKELRLLSSVAEIGILGRSLTGVDIPLIRIGSDSEQKRKPVVFVTGRVHPGQSNGSILLSGLVKYLCFSSEAQFLRNKVIFLIIPMINPDGVIIGNSRTGASGKDLNRQFRSSNEHLFPQVHLLKRLVKKVLTTHEIQTYLDFHGHSCKKNLFVFGPQYNITQTEYYRSRVFPKLLAGMTTIFRYFGSNFAIPDNKRNTARAVMFNEFKIPFVYTIEGSIGIYRDFQNNKDMPFTVKQWETLGQNICEALKEYFEGIDQYQQFLQQRRLLKVKEKTQPQISPKRLSSLKPKDLKILKIYDQIKVFEEKNKKNDEDDSDGSSDSQNQEQNLQRQMMKQFQGMIAEGVQYQASFQGRKKKERPKIQRPTKSKSLKPSKQQEIDIMEQFMNQLTNPKISNPGPKRIMIQSQRHCRHKNYVEEVSKKEQTVKLEKITPKLQSPKHRNMRQYNQELVCYSEKVDDCYSFNQNVTIFNFSRMIQNPKSLRYYAGQSEQRLNHIHKKSQTIHHIPFDNRSMKINHLTLSEINQGMPSLSLDDRQLDNTEAGRNLRIRNPYPSSFYRIKYQAANKKKRKQQEQSKDKLQKEIDIPSNNHQRQNFLNIKKAKH